MSLQKFFFGMGLLVALLPYLGFPSSTDAILFLISGLLIMYGAYRMQAREVISIKSPVKRATRPRTKKVDMEPQPTPYIPEDMPQEEVITPHFDEQER